MPRYLIAWMDETRHGNVDMPLERPIRDMDDVLAIQWRLKRDFGAVNPILMGFSRFEEEQ